MPSKYFPAVGYIILFLQLQNSAQVYLLCDK